MNSRPLVSIIIASYNCEQYIERCINSLLNQTYDNIEIIVCDDMSTDKSYEVLNKYAQKRQIKLLKNQRNLRAAATRNNCIKEAKGKYIAIQDADDYSDRKRIEKQVEFLESNGSYAFVSTNAHLFSEQRLESNDIMSFGKKYPSKWSFLWGPPFIHPATMFRAECINAVNGYRVAEETRRGQDYDLFMRLYARGYKGANLAEPLYWYRLDENTVKRHSLSGSHDEYLVRMKGFRMLGLMPLGYLFAIKPYIANFAHKMGWFKYNLK